MNIHDVYGIDSGHDSCTVCLDARELMIVVFR